MKITFNHKHFVAVLAIFVPIITFMAVNVAHAAAISWTSPLPAVSDKVDTHDGIHSAMYCQQPHQYLEKVTVHGVQNPGNACVTQGKNVKFGMFHTESGGFYHVVSFPGDSKMYIVPNYSCALNNPYCVYIPELDILVAREQVNGSFYGSKLVIYKNYSSRLARTTHSNFGTAYNFDTSNPALSLVDATNTVVPVWSLGVSANGRWLIAGTVGKGMLRIDLDQMVIKKFADIETTESYARQFEYSLSDDGRYIAVMGRTDPTIYTLTEGCGRTLTAQSTGGEYSNPLAANAYCPKLTLGSYPGLTVDHLTNAYSPKFSADGGELRFYANSSNNFGLDGRWVTLRASGYAAPARLDYLALGDSYSSGEGDIMRRPEGERYYMLGTDVKGDYAQGIPREKCHISSRSYPFKLMTYMKLSSHKGKTIACSGAWATKDILQSKGYYGQDERLKNFTETALLQGNARTNFIAGRVQQAEFVERNHPKAMTLTAGGNDIEFAKKIPTCVTNLPTENCWLTTDDGKMYMGDEIQRSYKKLKKLYQELKLKANNGKIYVLSYPQFVSNQLSNCLENVQLSLSERTLVHESVRYFNQVIKAAANDAGVKYVDIEDALSGHKLCEFGENFVTGIAGYGTVTEQQEMFHPNAKGHQAVFEKIKEGLGSQTLLDTTACNTIIVCPAGAVGEPSIPSYFTESMSLNQRVIQAYDFIKDNVQAAGTGAAAAVKKGVDWLVQTAPYAIQPTTIVRAELHSDPVDLGSYMTNADGSISANLNIPSGVPAGYHTLHFYGKTYSGEDIDLYQIIEVQGANGDIDEDGTADSGDKCLYVTAANKDADLDGIDDACDPEISSDPQLYRVRNGDVSNNEQASYLYIERNTLASSVTGVTNDNDPDKDGWALVGASQGGSDVGKVANFWVDSNQVPHVSVRTAENGCVQFTSADLSRVLPLTARLLTQEAANIGTCRIESVTEDTDRNGLADNNQPLYKARNGIASKGEDVSGVYVERTTRTAEAKLKVSDYASDDPSLAVLNSDNRTIWSLLASSQTVATKGVFKKLVVVNNQPIILILNTSNQCIALKPSSLSAIKQSTQFTRGLQQTTIPTGESCNA